MILPLRVLGSTLANRISSGRAMAPMTLPTCFFNSLASAAFAFHTGLQGDEGDHGLALDFIRAAHGGGFGDGGMADEGALDFGGAEAVAGDVEHVVDAAHDPEVAVLIAACAVAGEIDVLVGAPVGRPRSAPRRRRWCAAWRAMACG